METGATIFDYCERGGNAAFWAEPLNAITNAGFIVAALAGLYLTLKRQPEQRSLWHYFFAADFFAIGIGSFLFHTVPNGQTVQADVIPIGIFMLSYLGFAVRRFVGLNLVLTALSLLAFIGLMIGAADMKCWDGRFGFAIDIPSGAQAKCLNGSLGYGPAFLALWLIGGILYLRRHDAAPYVLAAGTAFLVSLTFRSLDFTLCDSLVIGGHKIGMHFLWHLFNSLTLFLLLLTAIKFGTGTQTVLPPRPRAAGADYAISR